MKKTILLLAFMMSLISLTSCKMIKSETKQDVVLTGTEWVLVSIGDRKFEKLEGMRAETIGLSFLEDSFGSSDGCNGLGGTFKQDGHNIEMTNIRSTRMYCKNIMDKLYNIPFMSVTSFEVKNNELKLLDASKKVVATFKKK